MEHSLSLPLGLISPPPPSLFINFREMMKYKTTTISISVTSENIIPWKIDLEIRYNIVKFWSVTPVIAALILLAMLFNLSISSSKMFILIWKKCHHFLLSGSQIVTFTVEDIWTGPGFRLTSPESSKKNWQKFL